MGHINVKYIAGRSLRPRVRIVVRFRIVFWFDGATPRPLLSALFRKISPGASLFDKNGLADPLCNHQTKIVHPQISKAFVLLEQQLRALDENHLKQRTSLLTTMEGLKRHGEFPEDSPKMVTMPAKQGPGRPKSKASNEATTQVVQSISQILLEAVRAQTQPFQPVDLRGYIDTRYPGQSSTITGDRISKELYALRVRGVVAIHKKGLKGHPSTYSLMETEQK